MIRKENSRARGIRRVMKAALELDRELGRLACRLDLHSWRFTDERIRGTEATTEHGVRVLYDVVVTTARCRRCPAEAIVNLDDVPRYSRSPW